MNIPEFSQVSASNLKKLRRPLIAIAAASSVALAGCADNESASTDQQTADHSVSSLASIMRQKGYDILDSRAQYDPYLAFATVQAAAGSKCIVEVDTPLYEPNGGGVMVGVATNPDLGGNPVDSLDPFLASRNDIPSYAQLMARPLVARSCE